MVRHRNKMTDHDHEFNNASASSRMLAVYITSVDKI